MPKIKENLSHAIIGNSSIACPRCGNNNLKISEVVIISNNRNIVIDDTAVSIEQDKTYEIPTIYEHYKNMRQQPGDNNLIFNLQCSTFDCPSSVILFHQTKKGLIVEFADGDDTKKLESEFTIKEKYMDVILFINKETQEVITMKRSPSSHAWFIHNNKHGNKEVEKCNSNFLKLYQRRIIKGVPVTGWVKSVNNKNVQLKLFVRKNEKFSDRFLFWKFRFKDNGSWKASKEENQIHDQELLGSILDSWEAGAGDMNLLVSKLV